LRLSLWYRLGMPGELGPWLPHGELYLVPQLHRD
jgi:hypothetical protein